MTIIENITITHNRSTAPTATNKFKVGDIFESKVQLLQAISENSIVRPVSFKPAKMNSTCYTLVCDADDNGGGK